VIDTDELADLKKRILKNLDHHMPLTDDIVLATILDPAMKDLDILGKDYKAKVQLLVTTVANSPAAPNSEDLAPSPGA
jgi:hypothetical protein